MKNRSSTTSNLYWHDYNPDWKRIRNLSHKDLLRSYSIHFSRYSRQRNQLRECLLENDFLERRIRMLEGRINVLSKYKTHYSFKYIGKLLKKAGPGLMAKSSKQQSI